MKTEIITSNNIGSAAKLIQNGELVAFPTETVYGIGANALNDDAVKRIFLIKKRPLTNPLIVHVESAEKLGELVAYIPESAKILINKFSPGPLTYVLPKSVHISKTVTGKLDTVAIRIPENKIALSLIKKSGVPIVAPSANISRRPSGTNFYMVEKELNGLVGAIIKTDEDSRIGIESTVISFDNFGNVLILRPGAITKKMIGDVLSPKYKAEYALSDAEKAKSPGNLTPHYQPKIPVYLFKRQTNIRPYINKNTKILITEKTYNSYWLRFLLNKNDFKVFNTLEEYAKNLYKEFFKAENKYKRILVELLDDTELGYSINNRLVKASSNTFLDSIK